MSALCIPRKRHQCRVCGQVIEQGRPCKRWSGVMDGEGWFTSHAHPICSRYMQSHRHEDWEIIFPGDVSTSEVHDWEYDLLMFGRIRRLNERVADFTVASTSR